MIRPRFLVNPTEEFDLVSDGIFEMGAMIDPEMTAWVLDHFSIVTENLCGGDDGFI
jgi:hypothetical protein